MARDGVFLPAARRVHPRYRTPHVAIVALRSWSVVLALSGTLRAALHLRDVRVHPAAHGRRVSRSSGCAGSVPDRSAAVPRRGATPVVPIVVHRWRSRAFVREHAGGASDGVVRRAWASSRSGCRCITLAEPGKHEMKFAILGSGAVGGYYGARLARAGHDVTFIARGAHLAAIRERGLQIRSPMLGDFVVRARRRGRHGERRPGRSRARRGQGLRQPDGAAAAAADARRRRRRCSPLQNGVDSASEVAAHRWARTRTLGGTTYIAHRARGSGPHRADRHAPAHRVRRGVRRAAADERSRAAHPRSVRRAPISSPTPVEDGRVPIWEKFIFLVVARRVHRRGAAADRPGLGRSVHRAQFLAGCREIERRRARRRRAGRRRRRRAHRPYIDAIPGTMRSSLLIDLSQGKRIEVEALQGTVVRRAARARRADADHVDAVCGAEAVGERGAVLERIAHMQT